MAPLKLTTPTSTSIQLERTFRAPLNLVWRAFTEADLVQRWLSGPEGHTMPVCEIDFRVGGAWRYVWQMPNGRMEGQGIFQEIVHHERYVHSEAFDIAPEMESIVETHFAQSTDITVVTMLIHYADEAARDMTLRHGMDRGMEASFVNLDQLLSAWP